MLLCVSVCFCVLLCATVCFCVLLCVSVCYCVLLCASVCFCVLPRKVGEKSNKHILLESLFLDKCFPGAVSIHFPHQGKIASNVSCVPGGKSPGWATLCFFLPTDLSDGQTGPQDTDIRWQMSFSLSGRSALLSLCHCDGQDNGL